MRVRPEFVDEETSSAAWGMLLFQVGKPQRTEGALSFVAEVRAEPSQIGHAGDAVTVSSPWPSLWGQPARVEADVSRGIIPLRHEYRELFCDDVEVDLRSLPRWRPQTTLTRRMLDSDDA